MNLPNEDVFGGCKENLFLNLEAAVVASCGIFFNAPLARGEVNNTALREEVKELTNNMTEALKNLRTIIAHLSDPEKPKLVTAASNLGVDAVCHLRIAKNRHEIPAEHSVAVNNLVSSRKEILVCLGQLEFKDGEEPNQGALETCNDIAKAIENLIKNKYKIVAINCLDSEAQQEVINISKDIARRSSQLCISTRSLNPDVSQSRLFLLNLSQEVAYIVESSIDCIMNYTSDQELLIGIELCIDEILVAIDRFTQTIESQRKSAETNERSAERESSNIHQSESESSGMSDQELAGPVPLTCISEPEREKRHLEREVMNSWLETNSKSPWFSNMLASLKYDAFSEILTKFTEKHDISMSQEIRRKVFFGCSKILKILHNEMSIIEDADEPAKIWNQSIIKVISRPEIQLLTDYILEGDLIYKVASESLLKNGLNSLGNLVSDEVLSYVKFVCCVLRLCRAGMCLKVDERNKEARLFNKIVSVTDEDGVEKRWFLRDLDDSTCRVGFSTEKIISLMYYNIFCKKFVDLPRFLTVAWDWSSFFSLLSYIAIKELQYDEKTFFEIASVGFDPEQECSILYAGKRMLDKDLSIKSPAS